MRLSLDKALAVGNQLEVEAISEYKMCSPWADASSQAEVIPVMFAPTFPTRWHPAHCVNAQPGCSVWLQHGVRPLGEHADLHITLGLLRGQQSMKNYGLLMHLWCNFPDRKHLVWPIISQMFTSGWLKSLMSCRHVVDSYFGLDYLVFQFQHFKNWLTLNNNSLHQWLKLYTAQFLVVCNCHFGPFFFL